MFMLKCFSLLIHILVVEDYELPKSTSHILSVPLNLEWLNMEIWNLDPSLIFSYFNCLHNHCAVLCKIAI